MKEKLIEYIQKTTKEAVGVGAFQREFRRSGELNLEARVDSALAGVIQFTAPIISRRLEEGKETKNWDDYLFAVSVLADVSIIGLIILGNPNLFAAIPWKLLYNLGVSAVPHKIK